MTITYVEKIVCFIDILGFKDLIERKYVNDPKKIHDILSKIKLAITNWADVPIASGIDLQITQFSDSLVFSFLPSKHYFMTFNFFKELSILMIEEGIVFRGGITYGKIHHGGELVFGPAMNRAYHLENEVAVFPRIIIDDAALNLENEDRKKITDYPGQFVFTIGTDDYSYVDYTYDVGGYANREQYYQKLRKIITKGLACGVEKVVKKYEWMKKEYNRAKATFQDLEPL